MCYQWVMLYKSALRYHVCLGAGFSRSRVGEANDLKPWLDFCLVRLPTSHFFFYKVIYQVSVEFFDCVRV